MEYICTGVLFTKKLLSDDSRILILMKGIEENSSDEYLVAGVTIDGNPENLEGIVAVSLDMLRGQKPVQFGNDKFSIYIRRSSGSEDIYRISVTDSSVIDNIITSESETIIVVPDVPF